MNDTIKVGDRVYRWVDRDAGYVLRATRGPWAWIERDDGTFRTVGLGSLAKLTPIEPEPVTLTVGQRVRLCEGRVGVIKDLREEAYVEIDDSREITVHSPPLRIWKLSSELEPVPEPCPECKGSGKASE